MSRSADRLERPPTPDRVAVVGSGGVLAAAAAAIVPGARRHLAAEIDIQQAATVLAAIVEPHTLELYLDELERRWEFALETARTSTRNIRPDKAALIRAMTAEISMGIL